MPVAQLILVRQKQRISVAEHNDKLENVWGPILTVCWGLLVIALCGVAQAAVIYLIAARTGVVSLKTLPAVIEFTKYSGFILAWCSLVGAVVGVIATVAIVKLKSGSDLTEYLGLTFPGWRQLVQWFVVLILFFGLPVVSSPGEPISPDYMLRTYSSMHSHWLLWLAFLIAAPAFEEIFFRGFLIQGLSASALQWPGAVAVSAIAWALMHVQYDRRAVTIILLYGLFLGVARVKTGSTIVTMVLHAFLNLVATVQTVIRFHHIFA